MDKWQNQDEQFTIKAGIDMHTITIITSFITL